MALLNELQILELGFESVGDNVRISDKASFYNASNITLGNNVRIDDFTVLSAGPGGINIGNHVHIAVYSSLIGAGSIALRDFVNISSRVSIYSSSDDYSGHFMTNPCVHESFKNVLSEAVVLEKHVIVGCGTVILPGVTLNEGVAIGALSLVTKSLEPFTICAGIPAKFIRARSRDLLKLENLFLNCVDSN
jgi:acetyltransferase-like isoleucine patch superfamily enzyme